jgi:hypothetical protein
MLSLYKQFVYMAEFHWELGAVGAPKILEFFFVFTNNETILGSVWLLLEIVLSSGLSSTKHTLYTHTHTHMI